MLLSKYSQCETEEHGTISNSQQIDLRFNEWIETDALPAEQNKYLPSSANRRWYFKLLTVRRSQYFRFLYQSLL